MRSSTLFDKHVGPPAVHGSTAPALLTLSLAATSARRWLTCARWRAGGALSASRVPVASAPGPGTLSRWSTAWALSVLLASTALAACRESDFTGVPGPPGALAVDSDPRGATIVLDGEDTGQITPDTLHEVDRGDHELSVRLDSAGATYSFRVPVTVEPDTLRTVSGPLLLSCASNECFESQTRYHERGRLRFATRTGGTLLHLAGSGAGLFWPAGTTNSYVSVGAAVFAGVIPEGVIPEVATVALGPYNLGEELGYLIGRPAPPVEEEGSRLSFRQSSWVVPPPRLIGSATTARGIAIDQEVIASDDVEDALLIRLVFHNISNDPLYRVLELRDFPEAGITYEDVYIGFVLDGDVGVAEDDEDPQGANDDLLSYDPDLDMAFIYDSDFHEPEFEDGWADGPGLVGVRVLAAPADATVLLNGWPRQAGQRAIDWAAGTATEPEGWDWLSATQTLLANHDDPRIGFADASPSDVRVSVSAGPLSLAPGESAALTVAVVLAPPVEGAYTSGTVLEPGDPTDPQRPLLDAAKLLLERAKAAEALIGSPK